MDVLLDEEDGEPALGAQPPDQLEDEPDELWRQAERRLVEEEQARPRHQRARDRELLLFAARERACRRVQPLREHGEELEELLPLSPRLPLLPRERGGADREVLGHGQRREQAAPLGREAQAPPGDLLGREPRDILSGQADLTLAGANETGDRPERRRLTRAVRAEEGDDLALLDVEIRLADGDDRPVAGAETADVEQRRHRRLGLGNVFCARRRPDR